MKSTSWGEGGLEACPEENLKTRFSDMNLGGIWQPADCNYFVHACVCRCMCVGVCVGVCVSVSLCVVCVY